MAIQVRREGPIDYILAGLSGAATGTAKGLESRQARLEREAAAKTQAEFKRTQLALQRQGIDIQKLSQESLDEYREAQIALGQSELKLAQDAARTFEQEKELKGIGPGKRPPTKQEIELAEAKLEELDIKNRLARKGLDAFEAGEERKEREAERQDAKQALAEDVANTDKAFKLADVLHGIAEDELDRESAVYLEQLKANLKRSAGDLTDAEKEFIGWNLGLMEFAITHPENKFVVEEVGRSSVEMNRIFKENGLEMPKGKLELRRKRDLTINPFKLFGIFGKETLQRTEEEEPIGPPAPPSALPIPQLGPPPSGAATGNAIIENLLSQVSPETQGDITANGTSAPIVQRVITDLKAANITSLSDTIKQEMLDNGYSKEQIKFIESKIKVKK